MLSHGNGVNCGVVEWFKRNTWRWFEPVEGMGSEDFLKKVYVSESVGPNNRGRPPGEGQSKIVHE